MGGGSGDGTGSGSGGSEYATLDPSASASLASARNHSSMVARLAPTGISSTNPIYALSAHQQSEVRAQLKENFVVAGYQPFGDPDEILGFKGANRDVMLEKSILIKWKPPYGWCLGRIVNCLGDMQLPRQNVDGANKSPNFKVYYNVADVHDHVLDETNCLNYCSMKVPAEGYWFLLDKKELHREPIGGVQRPTTSFQRGRPLSNKRKRPHAGPCS